MRARRYAINVRGDLSEVQRIAGVLQQRNYPVQAFFAELVSEPGDWAVIVDIQDGQGHDLLAARLNRLVSVMDVEEEADPPLAWLKASGADHQC